MPALMQAAVAAVPIPACPARALVVTLGGAPGDFDGMSHSGTLIIARNVGPRDCLVPAIPHLAWWTGSGRALPIGRRVPAGLHPGPVMRPLSLPAGASASTALRWVSGPVYDHSRCYTPRRVGLRFADGVADARITARVCGPAKGGVTVEQSALERLTAPRGATPANGG